MKKTAAGGKVSKWKQMLSTQEPVALEKQGSQRGAPGALPSSQGGKQITNALQQLALTLQIHNADYSKEEVLLNSDQFDSVLKEGDYLEVTIQSMPLQNSNLISGLQQTNSGSNQSSPALGQTPQAYSGNLNVMNSLIGQKKLIIRIGKDSIRQQRFQISILKSIADLFNLKSNMSCRVKLLQTEDRSTESTQKKTVFAQRIDDSPSRAGQQDETLATIQPYILSRVELNFRDQLVSRRDMWKIQYFLEGKTVYKNKQFEYMGIRFTVRGLFTNENTEVNTGLVKVAKTRFHFFSKSCQVYILVELSEDMYHFDENGFLNHEKCIQFLKAYFERCAKSSSSHEVTIVLYSRLYYPQVKCKEELRDSLTAFYKNDLPLTDEEVDRLGAFQISKHTKVFQDIYLKVGVFEIGRSNWEKSLQILKRYFNYMPSMINWTIKCPKHVQDLKTFYPRSNLNNNGSFCTTFDESFKKQDQHYMLDCKLGSADKQNILEAINLALFNLNNEEEDQNLKQTGQQLLIVTAGYGMYRINSKIIEPTKSRVLLGGIPIQLISLNQRPPYQTPLLINCCTYANPFKVKSKTSFKKNIANQLSDLSQLSPYSKGTDLQSPQSNTKKDKHSSPPYYYPYWLDIVYLPQTKIFESHGSFIANPQGAIYNVQKIPPYEAIQGYEPHTSFDFLNDITQKEQQTLIEKLLPQEDYLEPGTSIFKDQEYDQEVEELNHAPTEDKRIVIQTQDMELRTSSLNAMEKSQFLRQLEKEDISRFSTQQTLVHQHEQQNCCSMRKLSDIGGQQKRDPGSLYNKKREENTSAHRRRSYGISNNKMIQEQNEDSIIVIEKASQNSFEGLGLGMHVRETEGTNMYEEESQFQYQQTTQSQYAQSLQEKKSLDDLLENEAQYEKKQQPSQDFTRISAGNNLASFIHPTSGNQIVSSKAKLSPSAYNMEIAQSPSDQQHWDPFSPSSKNANFDSSLLPKSKKLTTLHSFGSNNFTISPLPTLVSYQSQPTQSKTIAHTKKSALKNRWVHQPKSSTIHTQLSKDELDLILHYGSSSQLDTIMEPFWKSLCEAKLLPLTTDYFPEEKLLNNKNMYHNELSQVFISRLQIIQNLEDYLQEYICLRLTQNFQLINSNPNPTCKIDFQGFQQRRNDIKMGMGDKYNVLSGSALAKENLDIMIYTKMKDGQEEAHAVKQADFKYMLYNFHSNKFQVKTSSESRLFNFQSLLNLGEVLNDLHMAMTSCIKMPQNHFVIFYQSNNWIFNNNGVGNTHTRGSSLFSRSASSGPMMQKQSGPTMHTSPNLGESAQYRSATVDITAGQTLSHSASEANGNIHAPSIDVSSIQTQNQLTSKLHQLYGEHIDHLILDQTQDQEKIEFEKFVELKQQLYDMLSKNQKSKFNTKVNLQSIDKIQIVKPSTTDFQSLKQNGAKPYEPKCTTATAYIEDEQGDKVTGAYFFSHDDTYQTQHAFHISISWIFANGPQIIEKINSLKRKVKSCGQFQIIPISGVANKEELNPFECFTRLKAPPKFVSQAFAGASSIQYPYKNAHKISIDSWYEDEELKANYEERLEMKRCTLFIRRFEFFLRNYYGFIIESENRTYRNYIHCTGIAILRIYHTSEVAWIENDVVNNQVSPDYMESHRIQEKVDILIMALDLILDIAFDQIILSKQGPEE